MLTPDGIKVLEYNVRLGDPEAQPVLFRLENDLVEVLQAIHAQTLDSVRLRWDSACSVCVVLASGGYPGKYPTGKPIQGIDDAEAVGQVTVFHAGTAVAGRATGDLRRTGPRSYGQGRGSSCGGCPGLPCPREGEVRAHALPDRYREARVELAGVALATFSLQPDPHRLLLRNSFRINLGGVNYGTCRRYHYG